MMSYNYFIVFVFKFNSIYHYFFNHIKALLPSGRPGGYPEDDFVNIKEIKKEKKSEMDYTS